MEHATYLPDFRPIPESREALLKTGQSKISVVYIQRTLKQTTQTRYLMGAHDKTKEPGAQVHSRAAKASDNTQHFIPRMIAQSEESAMPLLPAVNKPDQQQSIASAQEHKPVKEEDVCTTQPLASATKHTDIKATENENTFTINVELLMNLLEKIKDRDTIFGHIAICKYVCMHDCQSESTSMYYDIDSDWKDFLRADLEKTNNSYKTWLNFSPENIALTIQQLLFTVIQYQRHYHSEKSTKSRDALKQLENYIRDIIKHFFMQFGDQWLISLVNSDTYSRKSLSIYSPARPKKFDKVKNILKSHLNPETIKYRPEFLIPLLTASPDKNDIQRALKMTKEEINLVEQRKHEHKYEYKNEHKLEQRKHELEQRKHELEQIEYEYKQTQEKIRLTKLFTNHPLNDSFSLTKEIKGFFNFNNTCFIAAPMVGFIHFYLPHLISASQESRPILITDLHNSLRFQISEGIRIRSERARLKDQTGKLKTVEDRLNLAQAESSWEAHFTHGITQCVLLIGSLFQDKKSHEMRSPYETFIQMCIEGAKQGCFSGFEQFQQQLFSKSKNKISKEKNSLFQKQKNISDNKDQYQTGINQKRLTPKDLKQQDSAEFFHSFLQILFSKSYPQELLYYELIEKTIIRDGKELTIVNSDKIDTNPTLIYCPPISTKQSLKDDFSLQMILNDDITFNTLGEPQKISPKPDDFKYIRDWKHIDSAPWTEEGIAGEGIKEENKTPWMLKAQRTILLAPKPPELIIIQLKLPGNFYERAAIADRLLKNNSELVSITFRSQTTREDELQKYEKVSTVFHAEHSTKLQMSRHYRASIKHPDWNWLLFDDQNVYPIPEDTDANVGCGAPSMYILKKVEDLL